jgi:hypothetical protein
MEDILYEPVELTEDDLYEVAGGGRCGGLEIEVELELEVSIH